MIYLATREVDKTKKEQKLAEIISKCKLYYGVDYKFEDINDCDGCKSESGRLFFACNDCKIKKCAIAKGIDNCAYCDEYACEELLRTFKTEPDAKTRLDEIRNMIYLRDKERG
jgi:predicted nucleic acid binding AN1-type Zn finger protein